MKTIKRIIGALLMIAAPIILFLLIKGAIDNIQVDGTKDINKPIPWVVIITIFTPISVGLGIFGYYAFKGDYDQLPKSSEEI
jgi:hypothetical protein